MHPTRVSGRPAALQLLSAMLGGGPAHALGAPFWGSREASSPAGLTEQDGLGAVSRQSFLGGFDTMKGDKNEEGSVLFSREIWKKYKGTRPCWGLGPNIKPALLPGLSRTAELRSFVRGKDHTRGAQTAREGLLNIRGCLSQSQGRECARGQASQTWSAAAPRNSQTFHSSPAGVQGGERKGPCP